MKRLALTLALLPSLAWGAWSTPGSIGATGGAAEGNNAAVTPGTVSCSAGQQIVTIFGARDTATTWTASGGTEISDSTGMAVYEVTASGGDAMLTGTPSGGAAGSSTLAVAFCTSGGLTTLASQKESEAPQTNGSASTTLSTPARTVSANNSLILCVAMYRDNQFDVPTAAPAGCSTPITTGVTTVLGGDATLLVYYAIQTTASNVGASSWTIQSTAGQSQSLVLVLKEQPAAAGVSITSVDSDNTLNYTQTGVIIAGSGFGASQGAGSVQLRCADSINVTQTVTAWSATSITVTVVPGNCQYGDINLRVTDNSAVSDDQPIVFTVPSGEWYANIVSPDTLSIDANGTPNRIYGTGTDLADGDQLHVKRLAGSGSITLNDNGSFTADSTVTQFEYRYHAGSTWNTAATWDLLGPAPSWSGPAQADTTLAQSAAMTAVTFGPRFAIGEAAVSAYSSHEYGTVSALTTASGAGTNSTSLVPASYTSLTAGNYIKIGSTDPVRIRYVGTASVTLWEARTWSNGATISTVAVNSGTLPTGTSLNTSTGSWTGTPTTVSTSSQDQFIRLTDASGLTADSNGFVWIIDAPPVPPVLSGVITDQSYAVASGTQAFDVAPYATGESSCTLNSGSDALPSGWSFSSCAFSVPTTTAASWMGLIDYTNSGGTVTSNAFDVAVIDNPEVITDIIPTTAGYQVSITSNAARDCYAVAVPTTATAPSGAQIRVGTDGSGNPALSRDMVTVAANASGTFTLQVTPPITDVYSVCFDGGYTSVVEDNEVVKSAPSGSRYIRVEVP